MKAIVRFYRNNIYGIMGTLVFHILFFTVLLISDMGQKIEMKETELMIEFLENEPNEIKPDDTKPEKHDLNDAAATGQTGNISNVASNRMAGSNAKAEDALQSEIEDARNLSKSVNSNLAKKTIGLDEIKMPVETSEGQEPDKISNVVYSGESSIVYYLEKRHHLSLPVPVYLALGGGKVIVDIVVNQQGKVISARVRNNPSIRDEMVFIYARYAAENSVFNTDFNAPAVQKGSIHYTFSAQ